LGIPIDWANSNFEPDRLDLAKLPEILAASLKRKVIIILDDFDCISGMRNQIEIEQLFKSVWQKQEWVSMCLVMKNTFDTMAMTGSSSRPLYLPGMLRALKDIPKQIWHEYLFQKFKDAGRVVSKKVIEYMVSRMNSTPRSIQNLAHKIFISYSTKITMKVVNSAINGIVDDHDWVYNMLFKKITKLQQRVLLGYINRTPVAIPPQFIRKTNSAIDEIVRNNHTAIPDFIDPFFQIYLERRFLKSEELIEGKRKSIQKK